MRSIQEIVLRIKGYLIDIPGDLVVVGIIILVGFSGFGLGRWSALSETRLPVSIQEALPGEQNTAFVGETVEQISGEVVASKNGTKYHFPWCAGASQISEKNKITFKTIEEARAAGYTPASNCKGLE